MNLKHLSLIELIVRIIFITIGMPFMVTTKLLQWIQSPFVWVGYKLLDIADIIGNKLLRVSDEVKNGTVKDWYLIKSHTAIEVKRLLLWEQARKENKL